jgi:hypothetical protein
MTKPRSAVTRRAFIKTSLAAGAAASVPTLAGHLPAAGGPVAAAELTDAEPVRLHWLEGVPVTSSGTTFGIPWPRGALAADSQFAVATTGGQGVPVQSWPLAYWPDGTLKWTGHAVGASAGLSEELQLAPGTPDTPGDAVVVDETSGRVRVSTGVITVDVNKNGKSIIQRISRAGMDLALEGKLICIVQDGPTPEDGLGTVTRREFGGSVEEVTVEQSGPVRAVIKVTGRYHGHENRHWLPFTVRLYFYAGAESVRIVHGFIFDGDKDRDFIAGLGIRWQMPMSDPLHDRHIRFVGEEDGIWGEAVRVISGLRRTPGAAALNAQFNGEATPPLSQWGGGQNWTVQIEDVPIWNDFKLVQNSAGSFHVAKRTGSHSSWLLHAGHGRRALGLGWLGGPTGGGVAFGLRDFWERHPTQLDIRGAGTDEATVTIWFWSPDVPAMDLRHYDDHRHGLNIMYEEPGRGLDDLVATPEGIARSHEVMLWALPATPSRSRLLELAAVLRDPPLLIADPEYYHSLQPFGVWSLPDRSTPTRTALEDDIDRRIEFYQGQIEQRRWYGFWFHGDVMHSYDTTRHTWRYDSGGHAWHQGELAPDQALWYQFLRTGRADVFRMAEAMTLNIAETAVHHLGFFAGLGSRHNVIKWGDGAKETRISASQLKRFYYYLTADERTGDYMRAMLQADQTVLDVPPFREIIPPPVNAPIYMRIGPDWIGLASNWLTEWERTGNTYYRDRIVRGLQDIGAMPFGMFSGLEGAVGFDPATGALNFEGRELSGSYHLSLFFGGDQVFYELLNLVDVPEFEQAFLDHCIAWTGTAQERIERYGRNFNPGSFAESYARLMAYAGERLGDDSYKERAWTRFNPNFGNLGSIQEVAGPTVLTPVRWANTSTNDLGQRPFSIIQLLQLAPDQAP